MNINATWTLNAEDTQKNLERNKAGMLGVQCLSTYVTEYLCTERKFGHKNYKMQCARENTALFLSCMNSCIQVMIT